jgi:dTDP-4-dehydrorhamnose 3,5-epimerase
LGVRIEETGIPGCFVVQPRVVADHRGTFVKTFHQEAFAELGLRTDWREEYHSTSHHGVIRGMHFQLPPAEHAKLVYCLRGEVLDVVVDLRAGSPTFQQHRTVTLSEADARGLYIPTGCAHGFLSKTELSTMLYKVTSVHAPDRDGGIAWNSFGLNWPGDKPVISERDCRHPPMEDFASPFVFDSGAPAR